ncbi:MAG: CYTH domain-containing protein [FCB group bacterium]|jgi:adenylate cyclase|nr:CYTH domain-containing protein [FCB group bacterium]
MGREIERKFLVVGEPWREGGTAIRQAYLAFGPPVAVRVRIAGDRANLNLKQSTLDIQRAEYEYDLPLADAEELLRDHSAGAPIEKTRYRIPFEGRTWEVDVFEGANAGLVVAEIELEDENAPLSLPPWTGLEVSGDPRYLNTYLAQHPYRDWPTR